MSETTNDCLCGGPPTRFPTPEEYDPECFWHGPSPAPTPRTNRDEGDPMNGSNGPRGDINEPASLALNTLAHDMRHVLDQIFTWATWAAIFFAVRSATHAWDSDWFSAALTALLAALIAPIAHGAHRRRRRYPRDPA